MTTPVSGVTSASGTPQSSTTSAGQLSKLDPQAFLQLLVAQLKYQDPSNPVDTSTFMNQTATLSQVQTMNTMLSTLTSLANAQQAQEATTMIGKTVTYVDPSGLQKQGVVSSVSLLSSGATLRVGDADIPLTGVVGVSSATP